MGIARHVTPADAEPHAAPCEKTLLSGCRKSQSAARQSADTVNSSGLGGGQQPRDAGMRSILTDHRRRATAAGSPPVDRQRRTDQHGIWAQY